MGRGWMSFGAFLCALGIGGAAFGAHALQGRLGASDLVLWELAARYMIYGGFALILVGVVAYQRVTRGFEAAGLCLSVGTLVFSGTLGALALGGPRWVGAVTPVGGSLLILGFLLFALQALRS